VTRRLASKVALVTGASRGIGRAIALALAEAGADLIVTSTQERGADGTLKEIIGLKRRAVSISCDVSRPKDVERLVAEGEKAFGRIDVLINNAGTVHRASVSETSDADFDRVIGINLCGPFYLVRRVLPGMVKRGWGRVVNISSISGATGTPRLSAYCASKWGLNGLTRALAAELEGSGVSAVAVLPGSVDTDMLRGSGLKPKMTAEDVAKVVQFLCSEAPNSMNGSLVEVFG
jgi:3-oxoacyl-[acyl-carrier protein] reductase